MPIMLVTDVRRRLTGSIASVLLLAGVAAGLGIVEGGCAQTADGGSSSASNRAASARGAAIDQPIRIDGNTEDWPGGGEVVAAGDAHHVYFRFSTAGKPFAIQAADQATCILLDVDADTQTGQRLDQRSGGAGRLSNLGIDLEIQASPLKPAGGTARGVAINAVDSSGFALPLSREDFDLSFAPTYATTWYEARLSRTPDNPGNLPTQGLLSRGSMRGVFALKNGDGKIVGVSDPFMVTLGPAAAQKPLSDALPPSKPEGALRVMNYNVLKSAPVKNPEPFRRILDVLQPDVILFQEWEEGSAGDLAQWLAANKTGQAWYVAKPSGNMGAGGGVVVASRFPILTNFGNVKANDKPVRAVGAVIDSPLGPVVATSVHLKCCGTSGSEEDLRRMDEARAINAAVMKASDASKASIRVIAGDFNLVGSRPPLDLARQGLDADGSDMAIADAQVLGDALVETWSEDGNDFSPGRLDYLLYSDASVTAKNAFVFNTRRLSAAALAKLGLDAEDSASSDHMPVVVDLIAK